MAMWTEQEDAVLRRVYPDWGTDGVMRELRHKGRKAVWMRASLLGVKRRGAYRRTDPWTEAEDRTIREVYPQGGADAVKRAVKHRTHAAINSRAYRLGVAKPRPAQHLYPQPDTDVLRLMREWRGPVEPGIRWRVA